MTRKRASAKQRREGNGARLETVHGGALGIVKKQRCALFLDTRGGEREGVGVGVWGVLLSSSLISHIPPWHVRQTLRSARECPE